MKYLIILVVSGCTTLAKGQSADLQLIGSIGGDFANASIDVNFSAGEAIIETQSSATIVVNQGFQQPLELISGLNELNLGNEITLFPNPVSAELNIEFSDNATTSGHVEVLVFNANGQIVLREESTVLGGNGAMIQVDLRALEPGHYLIQLQDANGSKNRANFVKL